jgi:hypothetical protein
MNITLEIPDYLAPKVTDWQNQHHKPPGRLRVDPPQRSPKLNDCFRRCSDSNNLR